MAHNYKYRNGIYNQRGISLIETLVALFILAIGITAALSLVGYVSSITASTKNKIIATNLAREGVEAVRNIRDSNWLYYGEGGARDRWNDKWPKDPAGSGVMKEYKAVLLTADNALSGVGQITNYSLVPLLSAAPAAPMPDDEARVYLRSGVGYTQREGEGEPTIFARRISISYSPKPEDGDNVVEVSSNVTWYEHGRQRNVMLVTKLSDWWQRSNHD